MFALVSSAALAGYALQGPRLRDASVDVVRAVSQPNTILRLEADRPLDPDASYRVTISPPVPHQLVVDGPFLGVVFGNALRYGTEYQVRVAGVVEEDGVSEATWEHSFVTPVSNMWFLDRGDGQKDRIMRVSTGVEPPRVIYEADGINLFTPVGSVIVVAKETPQGVGLGIVEPVTGREETVLLPPDTDVVDMFAPAAGSRVFFTLRSRAGGQYDRTLFSLDLGGSRTPQPVVDLSGNAIRATKVFAHPEGNSVVVWVDDVSVVSVDLTTGLVLPVISEAQELWGVSTDGRYVVAVDRDGTVAVDIDTLEELRLPVRSLAGRRVYEGDTHLNASGVAVAKLAIPNLAETEFTSILGTVDDEGNPEVLYRTPGDLGSIGRFVVSPNDQYVAVEVVPNLSTQRLDGRSLAPRDEAITTVVIDLESRIIVRSVEGFWPVW